MSLKDINGPKLRTSKLVYNETLLQTAKSRSLARNIEGSKKSERDRRCEVKIEPLSSAEVITDTGIRRLLSYLKPGDILLCLPRDYSNPVNLFRYFPFEFFLKNFYNEYYSHAAVYIGDGKIIDSTAKGVKIRPVSQLLEEFKFDVYRLRLSQREKHEFIHNLKKHLGDGYDFLFSLESDNKLYCSELVYKALSDVVNVSIPKHSFITGKIVTPAELAKSKLIYKLNLPEDLPNTITSADRRRATVLPRLKRLWYKIARFT